MKDIIAPINKERIDPLRVIIITSLHLMSIGAIYFVSIQGVFIFIFCHYLFAFFGMSLGFHRYFSHRQFKLGSTSESILALLGTFSFQGGPIYWASSHRMHHRFTEQQGDPHSASRGFLWSHILWLFYKCPNGYSYRNSLKLTKDLQNKNLLIFLEKYSIHLNFTVLICAFFLFYGIDRLDIYFWAFPLRIITVWHATWSINSFAHSAKFSKGLPKVINTLCISIFMPSEGYHAKHHENSSKLKYSSNNDPSEKLLNFKFIRAKGNNTQ